MTQLFNNILTLLREKHTKHTSSCRRSRLWIQ